MQKISVIVEGKPNQLFAQGMQSFQQYDKTCKYFTDEEQKDNDANEIQKHLHLQRVNVGNTSLTSMHYGSTSGLLMKMIGSLGEEPPCGLRRKQKWLQHSRHTSTLSWITS